MLLVQTIVRICDNSGGFYGLCVAILGSNKKAAVGDAVVIAVKSILINRKLKLKMKKKVLKGTVRRAVVIRHAYAQRRYFNIFVKGSSNAVAILGSWGMPLANRLVGPSYFELKLSKYPKFATISEAVL